MQPNRIAVLNKGFSRCTWLVASAHLDVNGWALAERATIQAETAQGGRFTLEPCALNGVGIRYRQLS